MANEGGEWIMRGLDWDDPMRIRSWRELIQWINEVGFLPLFKNEIAGFSAEEHVSNLFWWTGDPEQDPWVWRERIAGSGEVAYGKFFGNKTGFISRKWFPDFANYRRDGYDFDSRWDDEMANIRHKKIMDCFTGEEEYMGMELKRNCGFGRDGYKNFDGIITDLQMQTYLIVRDFRRKKNKRGDEYGMPVCIYCRPEKLWGYEHVTSAYRKDPAESREQIYRRVQELFPAAGQKQMDKVLK